MTGHRWLRPALMGVVPALLVAAGLYVWLTGGRYVSTDNAYVQQDKVSISSDVTGRIAAVAVRENQRVDKGDLLFRIEARPFEIALAEADAAVAAARLQVAQLRADYRATDVDRDGAQNDIAFAREDFDRQRELLKRGFTTRARFEQAQYALQTAQKTLAEAQADATRARAALGGTGAVDAHPLVAQALAKRADAALDLYRTTIRAPAAGIVSQTDRLQVGQVIASGLPAVSIVAADRVWIEANFKETDLETMRVGQPAEVSLDAYPSRSLRARVASIGAGTGAEFSVLPAQNATGNWVKVVQRVPVRLDLIDRPEGVLLAGLSADVEVDTGPAAPAPIALAARR